MAERKSGGRSELGLKIIAVGKLIKVVTLLAVGIAALVVVGKDPPQVLIDVANSFGVDPGSRHLYRLAEKLSGVSAKQLEEVGFGSFVYAALFAVEGIGLWMKKKWAEYLTIVITVSFIPLELYELAKHPGAVKIVTLVLNVAVVVYLVARVMSERRRPAHARLGIASH